MAPVPEDLVSKLGSKNNKEIDEWTNQVEEVTSQIRGIIDGTITDFEAFDQQLALKERAKQIRQEELLQRKQRLLLYGNEGKGEGTKYKWWCKRCFVEYTIDLPEGQCTRCRQADQLMSQEARRQELMGKLEVFKEEKAKHKWRKDKWNRWKKSQALLGKSRFINYKAWEYWEPDTDSEEEGDPIVPRDNPEFLAMEADLKERKRKQSEKAITAEKCRQRGNQCMSEGDYVGAIENYDEGLEYRRDCKALWTNKALAELKVFRWHDAVASCNKVIEYAEIFEEGFAKSADACFKAFTRRATALRGLHRWEDAVNDLEDALSIYPKSKEALDLLEKTRQACLEAKKAQRSQESPEPPRPEETGTVRVEIEESFEDRAKKAADKLELGVEAMEEVMKGLTMESPMEISPLVPQIVEVLRPHLRPMDLRLCGKTAGALCNLLRLKPEEALVLDWRFVLPAGAVLVLVQAVQMTSGLGPATPQLLGALVNLAVARPTALVEMQHLGTLQVVIPLIDPEAYGSNSADKVISTRACLVSSRLLGAFPDGLSLDQEAELLFRLSQILTKVSIPEIQADVAQFSSVEKTPTLEAMDPPLRVLVTLLTKAPGALDRFVSGTSLKTGDCSISFSGLMGKVFEFIRVLQPASHVALDEESSTPSRLRGNLALLVSLLSDRQASENADLDLSMVVPVLVEMLRKERGSAQHNLGVSVTKLAQNPRYRDQVRELNGLESLHQIQFRGARDCTSIP
ncbi:unnamed protein product [Durusdinium trenchii]|uniref:Protein unc-45 homolog B n=1 Tax=Durusdinium trenchii TaxID=1381693 RepID=A0ABP0J3D7_9DINO